MAVPESAIAALHLGSPHRSDALLSLLPTSGISAASVLGHHSQQQSVANLSMIGDSFSFQQVNNSSSGGVLRPPLVSCRHVDSGPVRFCLHAVDRLFDNPEQLYLKSAGHDNNNGNGHNNNKISLSTVEVRVRVELRANGHALAPEFVTCATLKGSGEFGEGGCWVTFPVGFAEVPSDTMACCTVVASSGDVIGGASFYIFDEGGAIQVGGPWVFPLVAGKPASGAVESDTIVKPVQTRWDNASKLVTSGRLPGAAWMDRTAKLHIRRVQAASQSSADSAAAMAAAAASAFSPTVSSRGKNVAAANNNTNNSMDRFSKFWSPEQECEAVREEIALEEEAEAEKQSVEENNTNTNAASADANNAVPSAPSSQQAQLPVCLRVHFPNIAGGNSRAVLLRTSALVDGSDAISWMQQMAPDMCAAAFSHPPNPSPFHPYRDCVVHAAAGLSLENRIPDEVGLCARKAAILSRSSNFLYDPNAKPTAEQRRTLQEIASTPPIILGAIPERHVALLWQFRHYISREPQLLLPFVRSINWHDDKERGEAGKIVRQWKQITVADALLLLAKLFRGIDEVRSVAVNRLKSENDAQIGLVLLQLVQCLRYENGTGSGGHGSFHDDGSSSVPKLELFDFLVSRALSCWNICNFFFWYMRVEVDLEEEKAAEKKKREEAEAKKKGSGGKQSQQQQQQSSPTAHKDDFVSIPYGDLLKRFELVLSIEKPQYKKRIEGQKQLIEVLTRLYLTVAIPSLDRKKRIERATQIVSENGCGLQQLFDVANPVTHGFVFLPSHPHIAVKGIVTKGLYLFKSAKQPILLPFIVEKGERMMTAGDIVTTAAALAATSSSSSSGNNSSAASTVAAGAGAGDDTASQMSEATSAGSPSTMAGALIINNNSTSNNSNPPGLMVFDASGGYNASGEDLIARLRAGTFAVMDDQLPSDEMTKGGDALALSTKVDRRSTLIPNPQSGRGGGGDGPSTSAVGSPATSSAAASPSSTLLSLSLPLSATQHLQQQPGTGARSAAAATTAQKTTGGATAKPAQPSNNKNDVVGDIFPVIFKNGDDVRQDQLVIQVVEFTDLLLRQNGLDLHLTPYRVLATTPMQGFVECVPEVETLQEVQKLTVLKHLQQFSATHGGFKSQQERFLKSCAGYCVITYLLGVGDRHLENLLLTKDGRLLHIDFGFILGKDPKPLPPPMKLNKEMVEAMGGVEGANFAAFRVHCFTAYSLLRRHHSLFLSLLLLMVDASMPNFDDDGKVDPLVNLRGVQEKLRLDLSESEARSFYSRIIQDSLSAKFTVLWDVIHVIAQNSRQ